MAREMSAHNTKNIQKKKNEIILIIMQNTSYDHLS